MTHSNYFVRIHQARHFWMHLVFSDLRAKYRRSFFGILWALMHPLCLTLLLAFVMSKVFHSPLKDYAPFILSGIILWEFIVTSASSGCHAFINAEGYIRQFAHPLAIYSLRSTLVCFINLCFAFIGLLGWVILWKPANINISWLSLPFSFSLLFLVAWPLSTITALFTIRFRDFSQMIVLLLQALWYVSPVFFLPSIFESAGIYWMLDYNPIHHVLALFRAPLLNGQFPALGNYYYTLCTASVLGSLVLILLKKTEKKVIFYL